jgi:hypothetical protein
MWVVKFSPKVIKKLVCFEWRAWEGGWMKIVLGDQICSFAVRGGFYKSWAHSLKCKVRPNLGENAIS